LSHTNNQKEKIPNTYPDLKPSKNQHHISIIYIKEQRLPDYPVPAISWLSQFQEDPDAGNAKNIISNENKLN
jgi:hypothetical protein